MKCTQQLYNKTNTLPCPIPSLNNNKKVKQMKLKTYVYF